MIISKFNLYLFLFTFYLIVFKLVYLINYLILILRKRLKADSFNFQHASGLNINTVTALYIGTACNIYPYYICTVANVNAYEMMRRTL